MGTATFPFSVLAQLLLPPAPTLPPAPIPFNSAGTANSGVDTVLNLTGSGTITVPFGSVGSPGAKVILITMDANASPTPVLVTINGGSMPVEISPGGGFLYTNPTPATGVTSISIAYTSTCVVRTWIAG